MPSGPVHLVKHSDSTWTAWPLHLHLSPGSWYKGWGSSWGGTATQHFNLGPLKSQALYFLELLPELLGSGAQSLQS